MYGGKQSEIESTANEAGISSLFREIERGEKSALFDLYCRTSGLLFGMMLKILGNRKDAEEALLSIYTSIWKSPVPHNVDHSPLVWLIMIARAHALKRLYETRRAYLPTDMYARVGVDEKTASNNEQENARVSFESLAPRQHEILDWAFCSGLSAEEIAIKVGLPVNAIKTHVRIGLNHLCKVSEFPKVHQEPMTPEYGNEGNAW